MTQPPFWQPALQRPQLWRTLLGLFLVMMVWVAGTFGIFAAAALLFERSLGGMSTGSDPVSAGVFFFSFIAFPFGLAIVLRLLHRRRFASLLGPSHRLDGRHFARGILVMLAVAAALALFMQIELFVAPETVPIPARKLAFLPWLTLLPVALALILLQTFAEEIVFRGYLLQQLRARFTSPLIWAIAPSLLFGLLHFNAPSYGVINASAYVLNATVMGTLAAFVTLRTGNLGAAIGLHFGNNASLAGLGVAGQLDGFSLYIIEMDLKGGYTTYSILAQTLLVVVVFFVWWNWMHRHRPIANIAPAS